MLATLIPLFDDALQVSAYSLFAQKENNLLNPSLLGTGSNDAGGQIIGFDIINTVGIENVSSGKNIFVPINNMSIFSSIEEDCKADPKSIILLMDRSILPEEMYVERIKALKSAGFQLAIRKLDVPDFEPYREVISLVDFIILDHKKIANIDAAKVYFGKVYPNVKLVAGNIEEMEMFDTLVEKGGYQYYEGEFYRMPVSKGDNEVSPLKVNYIELLNLVNAPDFELTKAADIIGRDTALVIDLLKMVNRMAVNSEITSIRHAAAMLGQRELKKWINTAVTHQLCSDRPSEVMRLSLIRAKFIENLAPVFEQAAKTNELFLTGLFSVIDLILNKPMAEALKLIYLPKDVETALVKKEGDLYEALNFVTEYEKANWQEVSRLMILKKLDMNAVYEAYLDALAWYSKLFQ